MRNGTSQLSAAVAVAVICSWSGTMWVCGQNEARGSDRQLAAAEREACSRNLRQIYTSIQAYVAESKELPNWLSDLVPKYLADATILVCPVCKRTGKTEPPPLADPRLPSSYLFEFCPLPLGGEAPNAPGRTRREWKRRQMGLVGSVVPVVRCRFHDPVLNLAFDGKIYDSPGKWELAFTNRVPEEDFSPARLFADTAAPGAGTKAPFPERDPKAGKELIDLSKFYNARLGESWHGGTDNDLGALPVGIQRLGGVQFDVRGLLQLGGRESTNWPSAIKGIPVQQKCQRIHFLHAAAYGTVAEDGKTIGAYVVHFAANQMRLEIPIVCGQHVRDWHQFTNEPPSKELQVVWAGANGVSRREGRSLRLFLTTWTNMVPSIDVQSIDYITSRETKAAPFLVAISVD
jgi:hypothetical protein